jgi:hypothetical protein
MEVANFIVAVLSLIVTSVLTIGVYIFQSKNEAKRDKERQEDNERKIKERNNELARNFIINNQSEIDLLPLCAIASNVKTLPALQTWRTQRKYSHQIYLNFDKQPEAIKKEILRQEEILLNLPKDCDWVSEYLERLKIDAFECGMSNNEHCFLHDNAKCFHQGLSYYWDEKLDDRVPIQIPNIPINRENSFLNSFLCRNGLRSKYDAYFENYITETIHRKFGEESYLAENCTPPLDFASNAFSDDEKSFVLCMMQFVQLFSMSVYYKISQNEDFGTSNDRSTSTYEDYYYEALLQLYLAYSWDSSLV